MAVLMVPQQGKTVMLPALGLGMEYALVKKCSHCGKRGYYDFGCWEKYLSKRFLGGKLGKKRFRGNYQPSINLCDADKGLIFLGMAILAFSAGNNLTDCFLLDDGVYCYVVCCCDVFVIYYKVFADGVI